MRQQQQAQSYPVLPSVRQPFSMYPMSQQTVRPQQYMMGQHFLMQPTKVPFIQQHQTQQHMMMAQNTMLQQQMQNASMSMNQHETTHHHLPPMQNMNAVISEINGMCFVCVRY